MVIVFCLLSVIATFVGVSFQQQYRGCDTTKGDQQFNVSLNAANGTEACVRGVVFPRHSFRAVIPNTSETTTTSDAPRFVSCIVELDVVHGHEAVQVSLLPNKSATWIGGGFSGFDFWSVDYRRVPADLRYRGARARFVVVASVESTPMPFTCTVAFIDYSFGYYGVSYFYRVWLNTSTVADVPAENRAPASNPPLLAVGQVAYAVAVGNESTAFEVDTEAGDELVVLWMAMRSVAVTVQTLQFSAPVPTNWTEFRGLSADAATFRYYTVSSGRATLPVVSVDGRARLLLAMPLDIANWTTSNTVNLITVQFLVNKPCAVAPQPLLRVGEFADGRICQLVTENRFALSVTRRAALNIQIAKSRYGYDSGVNVTIAYSNGTVLFAGESTVWTSGPGATATRSIGTLSPGVYNVTISRVKLLIVVQRFTVGFVESDCRLADDPDATCATDDTCTILGRCNMTTGACYAQANGTSGSDCASPAHYSALRGACQAINASLVPRFSCLTDTNLALRCTPRGSCYPSCNTGICCGSQCLCLPGTTGRDCLTPVDPPALLSLGTQYTLDFSMHQAQLVGLGTETLRVFNWANSGRVLKITHDTVWSSTLLDLAGSGSATRLVMLRRGALRISVDGGWPFVVSGCRFSITLIDPVWMHHQGNGGWVVRNDNVNQSVWVETQATIKSPWANSVVMYPRLNSDQDVNATDPRYTFGLLSLTLTVKNDLAPTARTTVTTATTIPSTTTTQTTTTTMLPSTSTTRTTTTTMTTMATTTKSTSSTTTPTSSPTTTSTTSTTQPSSVTSTATSTGSLSATPTAGPNVETSQASVTTSLQPEVPRSPSSSSSNAGVIIGVVVGVVLVLLAGFGAFSWWRRNRTVGYRRSEQSGSNANADGIAIDSEDDNKL